MVNNPGSMSTNVKKTNTDKLNILTFRFFFTIVHYSTDHDCNSAYLLSNNKFHGDRQSTRLNSGIFGIFCPESIFNLNGWVCGAFEIIANDTKLVTNPWSFTALNQFLYFYVGDFDINEPITGRYQSNKLITVQYVTWVQPIRFQLFFMRKSIRLNWSQRFLKMKDLKPWKIKWRILHIYEIFGEKKLKKT